MRPATVSIGPAAPSGLIGTRRTSRRAVIVTTAAPFLILMPLTPGICGVIDLRMSSVSHAGHPHELPVGRRATPPLASLDPLVLGLGVQKAGEVHDVSQSNVPGAR